MLALHGLWAGERISEFLACVSVITGILCSLEHLITGFAWFAASLVQCFLAYSLYVERSMQLERLPWLSGIWAVRSSWFLVALFLVAALVVTIGSESGYYSEKNVLVSLFAPICIGLFFSIVLLFVVRAFRRRAEEQRQHRSLLSPIGEIA